MTIFILVTFTGNISHIENSHDWRLVVLIAVAFTFNTRKVPSQVPRHIPQEYINEAFDTVVDNIRMLVLGSQGESPIFTLRRMNGAKLAGLINLDKVLDVIKTVRNIVRDSAKGVVWSFQDKTGAPKVFIHHYAIYSMFCSFEDVTFVDNSDRFLDHNTKPPMFNMNARNE